ncbi:nucleolin-like [Sander lucioperca]|uniref:nucleolin-like n=1 Tax=Sander lucioperca TaxID=283035 RepID=UPI00125D3552|nr:nucleolin-like [Sander lucioperca]XP_031159737.1 nucleolin-like [Sander lucioperca]XP_035859440.1 nucleolin-like [Sander lucioperca]
MAFSRLRSPAWEGHLQIGAAGVSDNDYGSGSSQNPACDAELAEVFPQLIRAISLPRYIADVAPEVEVEEGEYIPPLLDDDDDDDEEDGSIFQYEEGEMAFYALSSDEEEDEDEDDEMLDDSGYDSMLDEDDDDVGHRSPLIQRPRLLVLPPVSPRLPPGLPAGAPLHLHPSFGIQLLFLRD